MCDGEHAHRPTRARTPRARPDGCCRCSGACCRAGGPRHQGRDAERRRSRRARRPPGRPADAGCACCVRWDDRTGAVSPRPGHRRVRRPARVLCGASGRRRRRARRSVRGRRLRCGRARCGGRTREAHPRRRWIAARRHRGRARPASRLMGGRSSSWHREAAAPSRAPRDPARDATQCNARSRPGDPPPVLRERECVDSRILPPAHLARRTEKR